MGSNMIEIADIILNGKEHEIMGIDGAKLILKYDEETDLYGFGRAEPLAGEDDGYTYFSTYEVIQLVHLLIDLIV